MKTKVIIVDDEPRAHKVLEMYVDRIPDMELAGNFTDALSARNFLQQNAIDIIFLDITMPQISGFDLLRLLTNPPLIIFTTAHPEFAFESYDYDAVDYLKKPIPFERFSKAVNKAISLLPIKRPQALIKDRIELRVEGEVKVIPFSTIQYFQSLGNYIKVITDEKPLIVQITTAEIESALPKEVFIRIHKSFIVNRARIKIASEDEIILGDQKLPIGKTFKKYVKETLS